MSLLANVMDASLKDTNRGLHVLGVNIGKLYTDHGLPIDMALAKLDISDEQKIAVLSGALWWLVEHRRNSGATEEAIERQRKANRSIMEVFIKSGETGVY